MTSTTKNKVKRFTFWTFFSIATFSFGMMLAVGCYQLARADGAATVGVGSGSSALAVHDPAVDPGGWFGDVVGALQGGSYVLMAALLLFGTDELLLWRARRPGSRLAPAVPWLAAGAAIIGTTAASLVATGVAGWRALPIALVTAVVAYLRPRSVKEGGIVTSPGDPPPPAGPAPPPLMKPDLPLAALIVGAVLMVLLGTSCGPLPKQVAHDGAACARAEIAGAVDDLVTDVESILLHGTPAWHDELHAIEVQGAAHGGSVLICAVQAAVADLEATLAKRAGLSPGETWPSTAAAQRGRAYLSERTSGAVVRVERRRVAQAWPLSASFPRWMW
jgi:hypothetical protein